MSEPNGISLCASPSFLGGRSPRFKNGNKQVVACAVRTNYPHIRRSVGHWIIHTHFPSITFMASHSHFVRERTLPFLFLKEIVSSSRNVVLLRNAWRVTRKALTHPTVPVDVAE